MATTFAPLQLQKPDLFGIRLSGAVGRTEKRWLEQLAAKCLENEKVKLVFDFSELEAIGGGGAAVLAEFQRELTKCDGEVVFVGAGSVVRRFLIQRFAGLPLRFFANVSEAVDRFEDPDAGTSLPVEDESTEELPEDLPGDDYGDDEATGAVCFAFDEDDEADSVLDQVLSAITMEAETGGGAQEESTDADTGVGPAPPDESRPAAAAEPPAESEPEPEAESEAEAEAEAEPVSDDNGVTRHEFVSIEEALSAIKCAADVATLQKPLDNLLYSYDLAGEVIFCTRQDDRLVAPDGDCDFSADGHLARTLRAAGRPFSLLDLNENELDDAETKSLAEIQPDLILPIVWQGSLEAVAFLRRGKEDHEYGVSENFALEMLMRVLSEFSAGSPESTADSASEKAAHPRRKRTASQKDLDRKLQQAEDLLTLNAELTNSLSDRQFWQRIFKALTPIFDVQSLALLERDGNAIHQRLCLGTSDSPLPLDEFASEKTCQFFQKHSNPVPVTDLPTRLSKIRSALQKQKYHWIAPLTVQKEHSGYVLLSFQVGAKLDRNDSGFLADLFQQVAAAWQSFRSQRSTADWSLGLVRTLVSLVEERHYGSGRITEQVIPLVQQLAREVGFPLEKERDLLYGTMLRDIGMVPLGDLFLHSPEKLTKSQWTKFRAHPQEGVAMLKALGLSDTMRDVILYHHERYNGEGYPKGLDGEDVPLAARIVAVVENYVAMVTDLPNRPALPKQKALGILVENWGERYDPELVAAFKSLLMQHGKAKQTVVTDRQAVLAGQ